MAISLLSDSRAGEVAPQKIDHAVIGGVVAVVMFAILCALIVLGRYFARHKGKMLQLQSYLIVNTSHSSSVFLSLQVECNRIEVPERMMGRRAANSLCCFPFFLSLGTYFTHEAKGADDAADADTAIINAEGGHNNTDEKKEYYI